ncbi:hypothetical protein L210DRAFT_3692226, partial [Boletus edulis BED1]
TTTSNSIITQSSDSSDDELIFFSRAFTSYRTTLEAAHDEISRTRVLAPRIRTIHAPQIHLLDEWKLHRPHLFRRKLRVSPEVFSALVDKISGHPVFYGGTHADPDAAPAVSNQLPVWMQLAIFLNGAGHYGNAATTQDMAEWAGVAVGTVYTCYKRVMIALSRFHDAVIHFDPGNRADDFEEKELSKAWVESRSCPAWRNGFLCVDGTTFNLFQKPGYHGEGFFDRKSRYSLTNQVSF